MRGKNSSLFELARGRVRLDHGASVIVNGDRGMIPVSDEG